MLDNPFEYSKPLQARDMVDREPELEALSDQLANTHNSRIVGPRRYGKTTLLNASLDRARDDGLVAVNVNFLGVLTLDDVAARIERAYSRQLESGLRQWLTGWLRTLRPTLRTGGAPFPITAEVSPQVAGQPLLDRLALPQRLHDKHGVRSAIAFDEFQDVLRAGANADAIIRSEIETHAGVAGYVFSGSHVGMMRELFADRRRAFFGQATPIDLGPLGDEDLAEYLAARFRVGERDPGDALGPLLDLAGGHPQRALLLANKLFVRTTPGASADSDTWGLALADACREAAPEVDAVWEGLTATQQRIMALVADNDIRLNSAAAEQRYGLKRGGRNQKSVQALIDEAHLRETDDSLTHWKVVDPLLELWLRNGRGWPV
jgi:uncharacterized protein